MNGRRLLNGHCLANRHCLVLSFALAASIGTVDAASCARFEPAATRLSGTLVLRDYAGPPNYEDVARGDRLERQWILVLDAPLFVDADPRSDINRDPVSGVREVQLVVTPGQADPARDRGRRITVSGNLFTAHTGHHRTPVLLSVDALPSR